MVAVFCDPVQHGEARDEVLLVEQGRVLSEHGVDVGPGARRPLHHPRVLPGLQGDQGLMERHQWQRNRIVSGGRYEGNKMSRLLVNKRPN